ncbi:MULTISPECIES: S26 family signal peptidase [unclassified Simplicispira]|uniref:S26 family signal peptidase n=1 Tax=unclassified Simplicispira TaxID=2630407 RepID=UPI000D5C8315|nr:MULTISPECIES: S26 family signal peptidase [unclassified Simplicispira]PVY55492.1 conjugation peptidase TraF [Simplicispira sp. 125]REG16435.1 conjugation peptidase TraF [Simplicispira sp. 110]
MTTAFTSANTTGTAPLSPSRWRNRIGLAGLSACGLAALAWASCAPALPRLIYNPSDSVAVGWYRVELIDHQADSQPQLLAVGSVALVRLPADAAALAAQRGYLPTRVPLLKRVGAVELQGACIVGRSVYIDGVPVAAVLPVDRMGRPLPSWQQCRQLRPGELFLLSATNPSSFDSRYFGPIPASTVIGVAHPIWPEARP